MDMRPSSIFAYGAESRISEKDMAILTNTKIPVGDE
jgi:hypothetical protein